jgi:hypothetical protein
MHRRLAAGQLQQVSLDAPLCTLCKIEFRQALPAGRKPDLPVGTLGECRPLLAATVTGNANSNTLRLATCASPPPSGYQVALLAGRRNSASR